jgi:hypothetical protein
MPEPLKYHKLAGARGVCAGASKLASNAWYARKGDHTANGRRCHRRPPELLLGVLLSPYLPPHLPVVLQLPPRDFSRGLYLPPRFGIATPPLGRVRNNTRNRGSAELPPPNSATQRYSPPPNLAYQNGTPTSREFKSPPPKGGK